MPLTRNGVLIVSEFHYYEGVVVHGISERLLTCMTDELFLRDTNRNDKICIQYFNKALLKNPWRASPFHF